MEREKRRLRIIAYCSAGLFSGTKECRNKSSPTGSSILRKQICATVLILWLVKLKSLFMLFLLLTTDFPGGSAGKESTCNVEDLGVIPRLGRSLGEENCTHSSIMAWRIPWTVFHGVAKRWTQLSFTYSLPTTASHELSPLFKYLFIVRRQYELFSLRLLIRT